MPLKELMDVAVKSIRCAEDMILIADTDTDTGLQNSIESKEHVQEDRH